MTYYLRVVPEHPLQVWKFEGDQAFVAGVSNPETYPGGYFKADPGETICAALRRQASFWFVPDGQNPFHKMDLEPGQFYPRMARPTNDEPESRPGLYPGAHAEANVIATARGQLTALTRQLESICRTVHPVDKTFGTFGHDIRNLLVLACTEVENHCRGILLANSGSVEEGRHLNMNDYVVLRDAMKLDEYAIAFPAYPWLEAIAPFKGWGSTAKPSRDLPWYDAYNAVKHNREREFERATLQNAFSAVAACVIITIAQFGLESVLVQASELASFFQLTNCPRWSLSNIYVYPLGHIPNLSYTPAEWSAVPFSFDSRTDLD